MKAITADPSQIAYCGLYCGACKRYLSGSCPGCQQNTKASWCKVRTCAIENQYRSCADCSSFRDVMACAKYNNFMAKLFGFVFRSDRQACITLIKQIGYDGFAKEMATHRCQSIRRGKSRP